MINIMKFKFSKRLIIGEITLSGFLYAMFIVTRLIFKDINIINGYSPQIHLLVLSLGLFCLQTYFFKILFLIMAGPFTIMFGASSADIFFNYFLPVWGFFPFIFLSLFSKKNKLIFYTVLILFNIISYFILTCSYVISGIITYKAKLIQSIIINAPIGGISLAISVFVSLVIINPISYIKEININIYWNNLKQHYTIQKKIKRKLNKLNKDDKKIIYLLVAYKKTKINAIIINTNKNANKKIQELITKNYINYEKINNEYYYSLNNLLFK